MENNDEQFTEDDQLRNDELLLIAGILMGAASADGVVDGSEADTVKKIMAELVGYQPLPEDIDLFLQGFHPAQFHLQEACEKLHLATSEDRRSLLALVAEVTDADDVHADTEDAYIRKVAAFIGAEAEEFKDLTMDIVFISSVSPPPLPPDA